MKNLTLTFAFCLLFIASNAQEYAVRKVNWGMSSDEVKRSETLTPKIDIPKQALSYSTRLLGHEVQLMYLFAKDRLTVVAYQFATKHDIDNRYILDYEDVKKELIKKYGQPKRDETKWFDNLYKPDPNDYGLAVSKGALEYLSIWNIGKTTITLKLDKGKSGISLLCSYSDVDAIIKNREEGNKDNGL